MSLARINVQYLQKTLKSSRFYTTVVSTIEDEYTKVPQYPEILDLSREQVKKREYQAYYNTIRAVKTVEEKQIKLNMPKYYGFRCYMLYEDFIPYDNLNLVKHITKTHLIVNNELPLQVEIDTKVDLNSLKKDIEEILLLSYDGYRKSPEVEDKRLSKREAENFLTSACLQQIHRVLLNHLLPNFPHLLKTQVDIDPRIEAFWYVGGIAADNDDKAVRPVNDKCFQYVGKPTLAIRSAIPLEAEMSIEEVEKSNFEVPCFEFNPHTVGITRTRRRIVNTPGFWPGDTNQFGLISYHYRGHMAERTYEDDYLEALHRQGILASFSWLAAQANFLGFTTYNDLTYPLLTQTIITNGQIWSFYKYQLNTMLMHLRYMDTNLKKNLCWATNELKLFEEIKDHKVIGFNDDVLKMLLNFYCNVPKERAGVDFLPFLSNEEKVIADYEDDDKRQWLEREYKFITSNRPRHLLPYEIYHWEKIYKIDHNKRPLDARRRPFELNQNPWNRTYDARIARYIPRKHRPNVKRHVGRYAKEYFP
ncbi:hypothetical protein FQA39_LY12749 [Lamprigera yunnana]|nr:hypothetical protein FQA39_LY12749 [Lamprigera yunnana]